MMEKKTNPKMIRIEKIAQGSRSGSHIENVARRWAYGEGANIIGYDAHSVNFVPRKQP